jgi:hypothetical protein
MKTATSFHSLLKQIQELSDRSVCDEGIPQRTHALRRFGGADHVNEGPQRGRDLPMSGIIQKQALEAG